MEEDLDDPFDEPSFSADATQTAFEEYRDTIRAGGAEDDAASAKTAITGIGAVFRNCMQERSAKSRRSAK
eukprot:12395869-Alexandrium_andersonii.AAC.1